MSDQLIETPRCRQVPNDPRRRWFASATLDLIVWFSDAGDVLGFQLCYPHGSEQRAFTWSQDEGYRHHRIDDGESRAGQAKATPILVPCGPFDRERVMGLFESQCGHIDPAIAQTVIGRLRACSVTVRQPPHGGAPTARDNR
jgi:hypothetical protein